MARINEMRAPTWAYLGLNKADYDLVELKNQPFYGKSVKEGQSQVQNAFEGETYGLSPEINKENSDFRNHFLSFDIDKNRETEFINLEMNDENNILISSIEINARENTSSSFLVNFADLGQGKIFINSQILVNLGKDSKVKLVVVVDLKNESTNLNSIATRLSDRADLDVTYIEIGATKSMVNIRNILRGEEAKVVENGVYFKSKQEYLDLMTVNEHFGINTDSNTLFNGA